MLTAHRLHGQDILHYHFTKGEVLDYRLTTSVAIIPKLPGFDDFTITETTTEVVREVVDDVAVDGAATIRLTIESVRKESSSESVKAGWNVKNVFDSSKGEIRNPSEARFAEMVGRSLITVISSDGSVQRLDGALAGSSVPGLLDEENITSVFIQGVALFSGRPLKLGDTWERERRCLIVGLSAPASEKLTVQAVEGKVAHVHRSITLKQGSPIELVPRQSMQIVAGSIEGETFINTETGRPLRFTTSIMTTLTNTTTEPDGSHRVIPESRKATIELETPK
jgi:hypothetical protein